MFLFKLCLWFILNLYLLIVWGGVKSHFVPMWTSSCSITICRNDFPVPIKPLQCICHKGVVLGYCLAYWLVGRDSSLTSRNPDLQIAGGLPAPVTVQQELDSSAGCCQLSAGLPFLLESDHCLSVISASHLLYTFTNIHKSRDSNIMNFHICII